MATMKCTKCHKEITGYPCVFCKRNRRSMSTFDSVLAYGGVGLLIFSITMCVAGEEIFRGVDWLSERRSFPTTTYEREPRFEPRIPPPLPPPETRNRSQGLGLTRGEVVNHLRRSGYIDELDGETTLNDGRARQFGSSRNSDVLVEMIGPAPNLHEITVTVEATEDITRFTRSGLVLSSTLGLAMPEWGSDGLDWLTEAMREAVRQFSGRAVDISTTQYGAEITYRLYEGMSAVSLFISSSSRDS